jgi:hypothetical protein
MVPEIVPAIGLVLAVRRSRASQELPVVSHPVPLQGNSVQRREVTVLATQFQPVGTGVANSPKIRLHKVEG